MLLGVAEGNRIVQCLLKDCTVFGTGLYSVWYRIVQCLVQDCTVFGPTNYTINSK